MKKIKFLSIIFTILTIFSIFFGFSNQKAEAAGSYLGCRVISNADCIEYVTTSNDGKTKINTGLWFDKNHEFVGYDKGTANTGDYANEKVLLVYNTPDPNDTSKGTLQNAYKLTGEGQYQDISDQIAQFKNTAYDPGAGRTSETIGGTVAANNGAPRVGGASTPGGSTSPGASLNNGSGTCFSVTSGLNIPVCTANLSYIFLTISSWLLWAAANVFDITIKFSLNMGDFMNKMPIVGYGWKILRDVANLCFIFILIAIAIGTILQVDSYDVKKLLAKVVITAVLLNFSLFAAKVVIDASNILTLQFYNQIVLAGGSSNTSSTNGGAISGAFVQSLGLTSIYSAGNSTSQTGASVSNQVAVGGNVLVVGIMGSIFIIITSFVFLVASILFIIRTATLVFVLVFSPLAFLARVLPQTKKFWDMWLKNLLNQSFFAPVYMICIYIVIKAINNRFVDITDPSKKMDFGSFIAGQSNFAGTIYTFIILIALMLGSLIVAKSFGAHGGNLAREWAGKATFGLSGAVGRQSLGRYSQRYFKTDQSKLDKDGNILQRTRYNLNNSLAKGSYDLRASPPGAAVSSSGNIGTLGKVGGEGGFQKFQEEAKKRSSNLRQTEALLGKKDALSAALKNGSDPEIRTALQKFSDSEYAELGADILTNKKVVDNSKPSQIKAVLDEKNDKLRADQKKAIKSIQGEDLRKKEDKIRELLAPGKEAELQKFLYLISDGQYTDLPADLLTDPRVIAHSKPSQIRAVLDDKNEKLIGAQKQQIRDGRVAPLNKALEELSTAIGTTEEGPKRAAVKAALDQLPISEKASFKEDLLKNPEVFRHFNGEVRDAIKKRQETDLAPATYREITDKQNSELVNAATTLRSTIPGPGVAPDASARTLAEDILKGMSGTELATLHSKTSILQDPYIIDSLSVSQVQDLAKSNIDDATKLAIGTRIRKTFTNPTERVGGVHPAYRQVKPPAPAVAGAPASKEGPLYNIFS